MCSRLSTFALIRSPFYRPVMVMAQAQGSGEKRINGWARYAAQVELKSMRVCLGISSTASGVVSVGHGTLYLRQGGKPLLVFLRFPVRYLCTVELTLMVFCALCIFIGSLVYPLMQGTRQ